MVVSWTLDEALYLIALIVIIAIMYLEICPIVLLAGFHLRQYQLTRQ